MLRIQGGEHCKQQNISARPYVLACQHQDVQRVEDDLNQTCYYCQVPVDMDIDFLEPLQVTKGWNLF